MISNTNKDELSKKELIKNLHSSESNEWYTPCEIIEAAREVMGEIDLDPASCEEANEVVRAANFFTIETDGLAQKWFGRVWLNSPYGYFNNKPGVSCAGVWSHSLLERYKKGEIKEAIFLVNANVGDGWWMPLFNQLPVCLINKRIKFRPPSGSNKKNRPSKGNSVFYIGNQFEKFRDVFERKYKMGTVVHASAAKYK